MRERTKLQQAIDGYRALQQELSDNGELIELGEAEGVAQVVEEAFAGSVAR